MSLLEDVRAVAPKLETKADIVAYFKARYPAHGKGSWKQQLVNTLSLTTGMKPKNLERRFDPSRLDSPEPKNRKQYEELGKMLTPKKLLLRGIIYIEFGSGDVITCDPRTLRTNGKPPLIMSGRDALLFVANPTYQGIINVYMKRPYDKDTFAPCDTHKNRITIEAVG